MRAEIDLASGALVGMQSKLTGWKMLENAAVGRAFEANVKLADGRFLRHQRIFAGASRSEDFGQRTDFFVWNGLKAGSEKLDIGFQGRISLTDDGLVYSGTLDNASDAVVEQLTWPFMGEVTVPEDTQRMLFQYFTYTKFNTEELYPREAGTGWSNLPEHAFTLVHNTKQGLYLSSMDHKLDEYIRCIYETLPDGDYAAQAGAATSKRGNGERKLMRTQIKAARMLYLQPGESRNLVPVIMTPMRVLGTRARISTRQGGRRGSWNRTAPHGSTRTIRGSSCRSTRRKAALTSRSRTCPNTWTRPNATASMPSSSPAGPTAGRTAACPTSVDPRLGTAEEFRKVIADAQKKGVNILLFTKFTWADLTTEYHEKYLPHRAINASLDPYVHPGYNYNTYTQLIGVNTRRFSIHCMMDDELRSMLHTEFQKCLDLGAAGMVYDENQHHAGAMLCFDPNHGHRVPGFNYQGADKLGREFYEMCQKSNPDFLMVGEGCYDLQSQYYGTYTRADYWHEPVLRYIDPTVPIACAVIDHNDLNHVNMCLADRYAMSYEVRNFKGHLGEFPRVMAYGRKVDNLRRRYADFLWNGEFLDVLGATVKGDNIRYTVFRNLKNGKKAVVVYNVDTKKKRIRRA